MKSPLITVLMPVYNRAAYVSEAMASILEQSYGDFEFLIIDDGSTDNSLEIVRQFSDPRIRVVELRENRKLPSVLNHGIMLAQGEWIARMDADDIAYPTRLETQMNALTANPVIKVMSSACHTFENGETLRQTYPLSHADIKAGMLFGCTVHHPTVMIRKSFLLDNNLFYRPEALYAEDYDLWARAMAYGQFENLSEPLAYYRTHTEQESQKHNDAQRQTCFRIRRELLQQLHVGFNETGFEVFEKIRFDQIADLNELETALQVMEHIMQQNRKHQLFCPIALSKLFQEKVSSWEAQLKTKLSSVA